MRYCNTKTSHNGVNNMVSLKNSTSLLSSLDQLDVRTATSVQTFDFSILYTSIPHDLLKSRISNLVHNAFRKKDGSVRYTHIKVTRSKWYFTHDINGGRDNMYTADTVQYSIVRPKDERCHHGVKLNRCRTNSANSLLDCVRRFAWSADTPSRSAAFNQGSL